MAHVLTPPGVHGTKCQHLLALVSDISVLTPIILPDAFEHTCGGAHIYLLETLLLVLNMRANLTV